jgi:ATP-binding cassette subfamily E protein 1
MSLKRIAVIDYDKCFPNKCNWICQKKCPINRAGKECISQDAEKNKAIISEELCTGCGICPKICPFGAITIINLEADFGEPIHSYGQNSFRLFRIPVPRKGQVVGILGKNGIGKSTSFAILSGQLPPNLGNVEEEGSYKKAVQKFKGKELSEIFSKIQKNEQKVSVKPQAVDQIPSFHKGNVQELLEKINPENYSNAVRELKLEKRKIDQLSGGELQKVAVAAAALKKAGTYFIDEPSSYLDIKERLRTAGFIRGMVQDNKKIMVIEHDLILLDYLSDTVHLMFGEPGVFGAVSNIRPTREGINTYLEGYLKDENYRFRKRPIIFEEKGIRDSLQQTKLMSWPNFQIKQGNFVLNAQKGELKTNESIGIIGPNGIGKTTFVKTLAGLLVPGDGKLPQKIPVAYKPQYVEPIKEMTVEEFLKQKWTEEIQESKHLLIEPLDLPKLYEKKLETLSGGELQKVAIAGTLGTNAPLILLDEPSAHLDVEQRLLVAKTIRHIMSAFNKTVLIVDHDLLLIDFVSDRLLLFDGEPGMKGNVAGPMPMEEGMNGLLKNLGITLRRDPNSKRPRINKPGSVKDTEQKKTGQYYYTKA